MRLLVTLRRERWKPPKTVGVFAIPAKTMTKENQKNGRIKTPWEALENQRKGESGES